MAKLRRIVRKVPPSSGDYFDEKAWPVYIALVVLGAFLMGVSAAYLEFSGVPWYRNAVTSLVVIPLVVAGFMVAFRLVDNRVVRRSMQLAVVLSAILHLILIVQMIETQIFARLDEEAVAEREVIEPRRPKLMPQYHPSQLLPEEDRPKQDFEKPLEVKTPEPLPDPDVVVRQEALHQTPQAQKQPVPTPQPVTAAQPNVVKRATPNESAPRAADQTSRLSRQSQPSELKISQLVQQLPIEQPRPAGVETSAAATSVQRQTTEMARAPSTAVEAPVAPTTAQAAQVSRQTTETAPTAEAPPQPTLSRQVAQPTRTPTSPIAAADAPPQPKATSQEALAPASTFTQKQTTASPQVTRVDAPLPEIASTTPSTPGRRQSPAETAPQVAQSPTPVANRQPRATSRPDVAATATAPSPASASPSAAAAPSPAPQASQVERAAAAVASSQPATMPSAEPTTTQANVAAARVARTETSRVPNPAPARADTPTMTRQSGAPSIAAATAAEPAPTGRTQTRPSAEVAAASTSTRRQPTAAVQHAPSAGEPAAAQLAANVAPAETATPRRATGAAAELPMTGPAGPTTPSPSRNTTAAVANVVTRAADVPTNAGPQASATSAPGPSSTAVARQSSGGSAASSNSSSAASSPDSAASAAVAPGGMSRAQASAVPTTRPQVLSGNSPARATAASAAATSPTAVDSPAVEVAAASGQQSMEPARLAINRAAGGVAGVGQSPNLDRASPGSDSPALVASSAARRAEATAQTPGDAFTPASAAQIARASGSESRPTATLRAAAAAAASAPGAAEVAEVVASSSATLDRADARATKAQVTGAKGAGEVDLGPTQVVAERGGTRAAGGGQPQPNLDLSAAPVARQEAGSGMPQMSLAGAQVADSVTAPVGESGGLPEVEAQVAGVGRTAAPSPAAASAGPAAAQDASPQSQATAAQLLAQSDMSRAEASQGAAGGGTLGQADLEDEEERARRLARAAQGGAPQLAVAGPVLADEVASPMGAGGDAGGAQSADASAVATAASRTTTLGGAPAGGAAATVAEPGSSPGGGQPAVGSVAIERAEAADGTPGDPLAGGGSESPRKSSSAPTFAANTTADTIQLAGAAQSSGESGVALAARGTQTERMSGGASAPATSDPQGAVAGDEVILSAAGVAPARGQRQTASGRAEGPQVADATASAPTRAAASSAPATGSLMAEVPQMGAGSAVAQAELDHMMGGTANAPMTRQSGQALAVSAEAPEGPGGLGTEYTPEVGVNSRRAREDSVSVQTAATRFVRTTVGGLPSISTTAVVSKDAFASRSGRLRGDQPGSGRGISSPETEASIEAGLEFLARHQHPDGHWSLQGFDDVTEAVSPDERRFMLISDTGATSLALLAFQGGGYTHREHQYKDVVLRGINHLLAYQKENGDLFVPLDDRSNQSVWLYSHALGTLALCEAYGMTQDPSLKEPAQKALDFIVAAQNKDLGGWRYSPGIGTDTSVTGWMIAALYSGKLAGLNVPSESFTRIDKWMNSAQGSAAEAHLYRYNPFAPDTAQQRHGRIPSKTMTAVGLLSRVLLGWKPDQPGLSRGAEFLGQNLPAIGTERQPQRDTYYWYYATLALVYLKERDDRFLPVWQQWEKTLFPLLRQSQEKQGRWAGSWNPRGPVPDRWALHAGRLYVTTMNLLSLEANYRHLPLHSAVQGQNE